MTQIAENDIHKVQIKAGVDGRIIAHKFEKILSDEINKKYIVVDITPNKIEKHIYQGNPADILIKYIANYNNDNIKNVKSFWLGALATSNEGDTIYDCDNNILKGSKSDILLEINNKKKVGISVKSCNKKNPTNEQIFFTTAKAFCKLLRDNNINVSENAEKGLKMFCGDTGFRPIDMIDCSSRLSDPERWFWEELPNEALNEWENIFNTEQFKISKLLLSKAYKDDPFPPEFVLHKYKKHSNINECSVAVFGLDELCDLSCKYKSFFTTDYVVRKGRFKNDPSIHKAPKFGFIQMQRGGQKQHPTQLQFNIKSGYAIIIDSLFD